MRKYPILLAMAALILASLACNINVGGPSTPERIIPVSTQAVGDLQTQIEQAFQSAQNGQVSFIITEEQLTSLLALKFEADPENSFIKNPQAYLDDGTIQIYGQLNQGFIEANVGIVMTASVDTNGQPVIDIVSADFGPVAAPEGLNDSITALVMEAYTGSLGPLATGFRLDSIVIDNGMMFMVGNIQ